MHAKSAGRGATLVELLISMGVFTLILGSVFILFEMSNRGFVKVTQRQDAHTQMAALRAALQSDIQTTHFYGLAVLDSDPIVVDGENITRSILSAPTLDDWRDDRNFDQVGTPLWNRWVVYRVTHNESGELLRQSIEAPPGELGRELLKPVPILSRMINDPNRTRTSWSGLVGTQTLVRHVKKFDVILDQEAHGVSISILVSKPGLKSNSKPENVEATFFIKPHNSAPID